MRNDIRVIKDLQTRRTFIPVSDNWCCQSVSVDTCGLSERQGGNTIKCSDICNFCTLTVQTIKFNQIQFGISRSNYVTYCGQCERTTAEYCIRIQDKIINIAQEAVCKIGGSLIATNS